MNILASSTSLLPYTIFFWLVYTVRVEFNWNHPNVVQSELKSYLAWTNKLRDHIARNGRKFYRRRFTQFSSQAADDHWFNGLARTGARPPSPRYFSLHLPACPTSMSIGLFGVSPAPPPAHHQPAFAETRSRRQVHGTTHKKPNACPIGANKTI